VQQLVPGRIDHENRQVYFAAVIGNRGAAPPAGPIRTEFTVLVDYYSPQYGYWIQVPYQEWRWYQVSALPFRTMWMTAPLHYIEDGYGQYQLYVQVGDPENHPADRDLDNNWRFMPCPAIHRPATFTKEMQGVLRRDSTIEGGTVTTTLTLDGKPIKASASTNGTARRRSARAT
jgi:hypothetical protein